MGSMSDPRDLSEPELLNVHQILADAEGGDSDVWTTQTFRLPKYLKDLTDSICKANGKDSSKFFRQCAIQLCKDYLPLKSPDKRS